MPAYNAEKTILSSIESVLNQTYTDWELIIIDDCSNDKTFKIASSVAKSDPRIHITCNKINVGVGQTRNNGIKKASSHLVAFLDADDLWSERKLERYLLEIKNNSDTFLFCSSYLIRKEDKLRSFHVNQKDLEFSSLLKENRIGLSTVVLNLKSIKNSENFAFPNIRRCEDYSAWLDLLKKDNHFFALEDELTTYVTHQGSLSSNKLKLLSSNFFILRRVLGSSITPLVYLAHQSINSFHKYYLKFI